MDKQINYMTLSNFFLSLSLINHRVWEKVAEGIQLVMRNNKGLKARLFSWAKDVGLKGNYAKQSG